MKENVVKLKSFKYAVSIVKLSKVLMADHKEYVMSKQLLKSGTSIGANIREAEYAQSKSDFIHKMSISLKEANETEYWLDLLNSTGYLSLEDYKIYKIGIEELLKMLIAIVKTSKANK